jgi:hypothetical protein
MDARLERLLRRDKDGNPLPLTPEEITTFSRRFGPDVAQQAMQEILARQKAAKEEANAAAELARKRDKEAADQKIAAGKAAGDLARQNAETERLKGEGAAKKARDDAETERLRKEQEHRDHLNEILKTYRGSTAGQIMSGLEAISPAVGIGAGYGLAAKVIAPRQDAFENAKNLQREKLGSAFDRIDRTSPTAPAEYKSVGDAARASNLIPGETAEAIKALSKTKYNPYKMGGIFMLGEGGLQRILGSLPDQDPLTQDAWTASGTANMGAGATLLASGSKYAANPAVIPSADALRKINLAEQYGKGMNKPPEGGDIPPIKREPYLGENYKVADQVLRELGIEPGPQDSKAVKIQKAISAIESGGADSQLPHVAAAIKGLDATAPAEQLRGPVKNFLNTLMRRDRVTAILASLGIGASTFGSSDEAEAGQRPGESITQSRLRNFPLGPLDTPAHAIDTASYWNPVTGPARVAADIGTAAGDLTRRAIDTPPRSVIEKPVSRTPAFPPKEPSTFGGGEYPEPPMPSDLNLAAARREDTRQRDEMGQHFGREAAQAVPSRGYTGKEDTGRQSDENYLDDLPDHERGLAKNGASPAEAALHYMPYVRAGAEAVKRGESFWGGTPTYERQRRALQTFYNAADVDAKAALGSKAESTPAPPPMEPDLTRARGGVVSGAPSKEVRDILKRYGRTAAR